jgi:hypothetical protein
VGLVVLIDRTQSAQGNSILPVALEAGLAHDFPGRHPVKELENGLIGRARRAKAAGDPPEQVRPVQMEFKEARGRRVGLRKGGSDPHLLGQGRKLRTPLSVDEKGAADERQAGPHRGRFGVFFTCLQAPRSLR